jgi:predicted PurR-regulated permease PerM
MREGRSEAIAMVTPIARKQVAAPQRTAALALVSVVVAYLLFRIAAPCLPALTWALALAVSAYPFHRWLERRIPRKSIAAGLAVTTIAVAVVLPVGLASRRLAQEADAFRLQVQDEVESGRFRASLERIPHVATWLPWLEKQIGIGESDTKQAGPENDVGLANSEKGAAPPTPTDHSATVGQVAGMLTTGAGTVLVGAIWMLGQLFVTFLALFFFFRDRELMLRFVRRLIPLAERDTDRLLARIDDAIHATVYGSLTVAAIQGSMGGLIFWYLGLPSPVLWGAIMGLLAVVPVLGTFVIWAPTAAYLALRGNWGDALVLVAWGGIAIALVDNFIYPTLVGNRLRYHTLLIFLAMVGGLALFGACGVILAPLLIAVADSTFEAWRRQPRLSRVPA